MKRKSALLLAFALLISLLAGCSGENGSANPTASSSAGAEVSSASPSSGSEAGSPGTAETGSMYPLTDETITFSMYFGTNGESLAYMTEEYWNFNLATKMVVETTGVYVEYFPFEMDLYIENLSIMAAGGEFPDIIGLANIFYPGGIDALVDQGICVNIDSLLPTYAPDYWELCLENPIFYKDTKSDAGNVTGIYGISAVDVCSEGPTIRKDYLDKLGLEIPETYDEILGALKAVKVEFGTKNPCLMTWTLSGSYDTFNGGFDIAIDRQSGKLIYQVDDEGNANVSAALPQWKDYVLMLREWYEAGVLTEDSLSITNPRMQQDYIISSEVAFLPNGGMSNLAQSYYEMVEDPDYHMVATPEPMNEKYCPDGIFAHGHAAGTAQFDYSVSTACEYPEIAVSYLNYFFTEEGMEYVAFGAEGETFEYGSDGKRAYTELITNNPMGLNSSLAKGLYVAIGPTYATFETTTSTYTRQEQFDATALWIQNRDGRHVYYGTLTTEESDRVSTIEGDIATLVDETMANLVFGNVDFDSYYDDFISKMEAMGLNELLACKQAAYERYLQR